MSMIKLFGKDREKGIANLVSAGVQAFSITKQQSERRCNALVKAIDDGMFEGIADTGPADYLQEMFVYVKVLEYMNDPQYD